MTGLKDVIHFEGSTGKELERAFRASIGSYLKYCEKTGQQSRELLDLATD